MANKFKKETGTIYLRKVPANLRNYFKAACMKRGKSMKGVILEFMKDYIDATNKVQSVKIK